MGQRAGVPLLLGAGNAVRQRVLGLQHDAYNLNGRICLLYSFLGLLSVFWVKTCTPSWQVDSENPQTKSASPDLAITAFFASTAWSPSSPCSLVPACPHDPRSTPSGPSSTPASPTPAWSTSSPHGISLKAVGNATIMGGGVPPTWRDFGCW